MALNHLLQEKGRGGQTRLATTKDIDRDYLNAIAKGRQIGSDESRARVADHFETTFEGIELPKLDQTILELAVQKTNFSSSPFQKKGCGNHGTIEYALKEIYRSTTQNSDAGIDAAIIMWYLAF